MNLQRLLEVAVKLLSLKNQSHAITEAICREHLFGEGAEPAVLADALQEAAGGQNCTPQLLDWLNALLFNACSANEELIAHLENRMLESTGDAPKYLPQEGKMQASSVETAVHIRAALKKWLQRVVRLPFVERILLEASQKTISKSKSLRSFLETLDYLSYKYQVATAGREQLSALLAAVDRKTETALALERAAWTNKRVFSGADLLVAFLNEIADNYTVNLASIAALISANYFLASPPRKLFESALNCGEVIAEEIADFLIRKCSKNDLFSEKMDSYRPFELLMEVIFQKFSSILLEFNGIIAPLLAGGQPPLYHPLNHKKIQAMASLFSYQLESSYPRLHHLLKYIHSSLLAKYSPVESLELMKKFVLNRFLLNPFYFALLHSPSEHEMERYVRLANEARILFYEKKMDGISQEFKSGRLGELAELLRNSLSSMLNAKEAAALDQTRCDKGIYVNDTLLGMLYFQVSDSLKGTKQSKPNSSELHSESSLSFSLRNDSASRMQMPSHQHLPATTNPSLPLVPKPRPAKEEPPQRSTSKIVSTDVYLEQGEPVADRLEELVSLRREYGELRRQIEAHSMDRASSRSNWKRQLHLLHDPVSAEINDLSRSSSQLLIHSLLQ